MSTSQSSPSNEVSLTYKFLLAFSTLSAVFFCWLYVTKPSVPKAEPKQPTSAAADTQETTATAGTEQPTSFAALTGSTLPGETADSPTQVVPGLAPIPLPKSLSTAEQIGWEETNDRIQHVLTAQSGEESERIILEVPVIYQTRGLRFDRTQAKEAARILRAMKLYQKHIAKLHQDGVNIQKAWDSLILSAQPIDSLRADSPSIPATTNASTLSENSAATINIAQ